MAPSLSKVISREAELRIQKGRLYGLKGKERGRDHSEALNAKEGAKE